MQKKATVLLALAAAAVAGVVWFGWAVWQDGEPSGNGLDGSPGLHIDVVAPKEPDLIQSEGKLSVGELTDGYDHSQTLQPPAPEYTDDYTTFDDPAWNAQEGTGMVPQDKRAYSSNPKQPQYDDREVYGGNIPGHQ